MTGLRSVDFEVFGKVQGVFFRKFTADLARQLQLVGFCRNTNTRTVQGQIQGKDGDVKIMKQWLSETGSPMSRVDRCTFTNERAIPSLEYTSFDIRR